MSRMALMLTYDYSDTSTRPDPHGEAQEIADKLGVAVSIQLPFGGGTEIVQPDRFARRRSPADAVAAAGMRMVHTNADLPDYTVREEPHRWAVGTLGATRQGVAFWASFGGKALKSGDLGMPVECDAGEATRYAIAGEAWDLCERHRDLSERVAKLDRAADDGPVDDSVPRETGGSVTVGGALPPGYTMHDIHPGYEQAGRPPVLGGHRYWVQIGGYALQDHDGTPVVVPDVGMATTFASESDAIDLARRAYYSGIRYLATDDGTVEVHFPNARVEDGDGRTVDEGPMTFEIDGQRVTARPLVFNLPADNRTTTVPPPPSAGGLTATWDGGGAGFGGAAQGGGGASRGGTGTAGGVVLSDETRPTILRIDANGQVVERPNVTVTSTGVVTGGGAVNVATVGSVSGNITVSTTSEGIGAFARSRQVNVVGSGATIDTTPPPRTVETDFMDWLAATTLSVDYATAVWHQMLAAYTAGRNSVEQESGS